MSQPLLKEIVDRARDATASGNLTLNLLELLKDSMSERGAMAEEIAAQEEDEVLLFENEKCSIWTCRFAYDLVLPPHEHCMIAHIAVYRGNEVEVLFRRDENRLRHTRNQMVGEGEVVSLGADAIHAVTAEGNGQSHAIHIYEGALTEIKRSLFNWATGDEIDFTMENFHALIRERTEVVELQN